MVSLLSGINLPRDTQSNSRKLTFPVVYLSVVSDQNRILSILEMTPSVNARVVRPGDCNKLLGGCRKMRGHDGRTCVICIPSYSNVHVLRYDFFFLRFLRFAPCFVPFLVPFLGPVSTIPFFLHFLVHRCRGMDRVGRNLQSLSQQRREITILDEITSTKKSLNQLMGIGRRDNMRAGSFELINGVAFGS